MRNLSKFKANREANRKRNANNLASGRKKIPEAYARNQRQIDSLLDKCCDSLVEREDLADVMGFYFYDRPSKRRVNFLRMVARYPKDVISDAVADFKMKVTLKASNPGESEPRYHFFGFLKSSHNLYLKRQSLVSRDQNLDLPDDL